MKQETRNKKPQPKSSKFEVRSSKFVRGQVLIIAVIFMTVILILTTSLFSRVTGFIQLGSNSIIREQAVNLAEAGVENTIWRLNVLAGSCNNTCTDETPVGTTGTFKVTITPKTSSLKTVSSKGCIPNCTSPRTTKTVKTDVYIGNDVIAFNYAVQVGTGGVEMENSSTINGSVYSNKSGANSIQGSGSSQINGSAFTVGTITSPDPTVSCIQPPCRHENQPVSEMPIKDADIPTFYQEWKDAATAGGTPYICPGGTCTYSSGTTPLGPLKLIGNLMVQNSGIIDMTGPLYVTGNVDVKNSAQIKLNNSFGSNGTVLITDGKITTQNSGAFVETNASPKGYILGVSTNSDLSAVNIKNSGVNAVFYAFSGGALLENSASVTALVAKQLHIKNAASLTYYEGLASAQFSGGPGGSWQIKKGTYRLTN